MITIKIAGVVLELTENIDTNLETLLSNIDQASKFKVDLILFSEMALSGFNLTDNYDLDKKMAVEINSSYINKIRAKAKDANVYLGLDFLELEQEIIYDSAILIDNNGKIILHYKRISPQWRHPKADSTQYGCGNLYKSINTPWGQFGFLICGDLFDEDCINFAKDANLDLLLLPFARCFNSSITNHQEYWDNFEWSEYANQIEKINAATLLVNYIDSKKSRGGSFGGAFLTNKKGELLAKMPLYTPEILIYDLLIDN